MGKVRSVTEEEKRERRDEILEAARGRFRRFGYSKTTMEEIAADAGISKGTIYIYFQNKEDIFIELIKREVLEMERLMYGKIKDMDNVSQQLEAIFTESMEYLRENPFMASLLRRDVDIVSPRIFKHIFTIEDRYVSVIEDYVRRGVEKGEIAPLNPRLVAYIMYKIFEAFSYGYTLGDEDFDREEIEELVPYLIRKALTPEKPRPPASKGKKTKK
jgi:AcrR family transcriptional regulator